MIWEKFWTKNFGPMGHPWGTWGQDLRRDRMKYFENIKSSLFGVHMTSPYHQILSPQEKFLKSFPPDVSSLSASKFSVFLENDPNEP